MMMKKTNSKFEKPINTLSKNKVDDSWYFASVSSKEHYNLNIDDNENLNVTNLWINVQMKKDNEVIGIVGTGLNITKFIDEFINSKEDGVTSFMLRKDGAIFASKDKNLMNNSIVSTTDNELKKIYSLLDATSAKKLEQKLLNIKDGDVESLVLVFNGQRHIASFNYMKSIDMITLSLVDTTNLIDTKELIQIAILLLLIIVATIVAFGLFIDKLILRPLKAVSNGAIKIANGDYDFKFDIKQHDEIGKLQETFNEMAQEIKLYTTSLETKVKERTIELDNRNSKITMLLNSSKEGFLSFGSDFVIDDEYSKECLNIFGKDIQNLKICELLLPKNSFRQNELKNMLSSVFNQKNEYLREVLISLLPREFVIDDKIVEAKFSIEDDVKMVLILKDITLHKKLQEELAKEKKVLEMVVEFVKDDIIIRDLINQFNIFCSDDKPTPLVDLKRDIHTFKGNFLQKRFILLPKALHDIETKLQELKKESDIDKIVNKKELKALLESDLDILRKELGSDVVDDYNIKIDKNKLKKIEKRAKEVDEKLYLDILSLSEVSLCKYLKSFEKTIDRIAEREEKLVEYKLNCVENVFVNYKHYVNFLSSLTHVFSNAVVHGVELPDDRLMMDKNEIAVITCKVDIKNNLINISIEDDGIGIDVEKIREKFSEESGNLSDDEVAEFIFKDGFSLKDKVDEISGRGVGLSAFKKQVEQLNGTISIHTEKFVGTKFTISIPIFNQ